LCALVLVGCPAPAVPPVTTSTTVAPVPPTESAEQLEYELAVSLRGRGFPAASFALLGAILARPEHDAFADAVRALADLALELPEAAGAGAVLAGVAADRRASLFASVPPKLQSRAWYLVAVAAYESGAYEAAIASFEHVTGDDQARALLMTALAHVQLHKSVPTVAVLERAVDLAMQSSDAETIGLGELAQVQIARTFYSAALRVDDAKRKIVVDRKKLDAAMKYWSAIDPASELYAEVMTERAWGWAALGDLQAARDDLVTAFGDAAYSAEAMELDADLLWRMGKKAEARAAFRALVTTWDPVAAALRALTSGLDGEADPDAAWAKIAAQAIDDPSSIHVFLRPLVTKALGDRQMRGMATWVRMLDDEIAKVDGLGAEAERARTALATLKRSATERRAAMARGRLSFEAADLADVLLQSERALEAIERARP
jgi:hypothetical protein